MDIYNNAKNTLPTQKRSMANKTKAWREQCVEAITGLGNMADANGRTSGHLKQINYDLVNSIMDVDDFKYVLNPYGVKDQGNQPAQMRDINLVVNKINLLKGEEMNRPFNFMVTSTGGNAVIEKENKKKEMLLDVATKKLAAEMGISLEPEIDPQTGKELPPPSFADVERYANYSMQDIRESWAADVLKYLRHEQKLDLKFNEGWEHGLISAEEIYYVGITNGNPIVRTCNPINCEFDRNPDNPNIEDGDWFREDRWMTAGQILDEYGEYLSEAQVKLLDEGDIRQGVRNGMYPGFAYEQSDIRAYENNNFRASTRTNNNHHLVTYVVWKSMRKIGFVSYPDPESGEMQELTVKDSFTISPEMKAAGYTVEWRWIPEVWHGTKISENFYVNIEPFPNQTRSMDNPSSVKLPYVGRVYNSTNTKQTSFVDLIKPHQYLYNIVWYRLEMELAKAKGKKMVMDVAQIPKSEGIDMEKWMYMFDNVGVAFVNSFEEGKGQFQGKTSQFNQFQSIDMGLSQAVGQYITILSKLEQTVDKIVGITPQREGQVHQNETVGGVERSISNSSHITEPWYYMHNEVKKGVMTQLLECAKLAYPESKKLNYITGDLQRINVTINMDKFCDSDYGIFLTDSSKEHAIFQKLEALSQQALSSGAATMLDIVQMYKSESVAELSKLIEQSELNKQKRDQEANQLQQQMQQEQIAAQQQEKESERMFISEQNQLDRQNEIQKAVIQATSFDTDTADSGALEALQYGELAIKDAAERNKQLGDERKASLEERKINQSAKDADKDRQLKREEIRSKERIAKDNNKTALKNKVVGENKTKK